MIKKPLCDEKGATSVLVIFMMIVLVTLGTFSISSAHVNYSFSRKALEWQEAYYSCDYMGVQFLADYDTALAAAEQKTVETLLEDGLTPLTNTVSAVERLYRDFIEEEMQTLSQLYPALIWQSEGAAQIILQADDAQSTRLSLELAAEPMAYLFELQNHVLSASRAQNATRYRIIRWEEWQESPDAPSTQDPLWDGSIEIVY